MQLGSYRTALCALILLIASSTTASAQEPRINRPVSAIPTNVLLRIMRAEDERRWDKDLASLLTDKSAQVRKRAALAAGRIGDERAVPALVELLRKDREDDVRQMAAFALGEIESALAADALIEAARADQVSYVRARALEALGKIAAALPPADEARRQAIGQVILDALTTERQAIVTASGVANLEVELLGLTAALRARPKDAGKVLALYLSSVDWRVRADALNALARLRLKDGNGEARKMVVDHSNPIVRANAARVLGATEDKQAFDALLDRALHDEDLRVRVSAIRGLGSLKDARAADPLTHRVETLLSGYRLEKVSNPASKDELLEMFTALGRILQNSNNGELIDLLKRFRILDRLQSPETEIALARISPERYLTTEPFVGTNEQIGKSFPNLEKTWRASSTLAQGLAEFASLPPDKTRVRSMALMNFALMIEAPGSHDPTIVTTIPTYLRAYAAFKNEVNRPEVRSPNNATEDVLSRTLRAYVTYRKKTAVATSAYVSWEDYRAFGYNDIFVRATAAELLAEQPPSKENTEALITALGQALQFDKHDNDAVVAILDALAKQKSKEANDAIKTALDSSDHLIRRRAAALLKANGAGDFSNRIGTVQTRNTQADYRRAIARIGKHVTATVVTSKGSFVIEFLPEDAPLTADNFIKLARKGFFNGQTIPRVVPNFVIQAGDPRGDTNGGPGYSIRCEINEVPYERAAVGMALSGKDTGGSQWFVTHSPQPHLDGGYTVFGRVIRGMDVVDRIARGDIIRRVIVNEKN